MMSIKYLHFTIEKVINPETNLKSYNLSHWLYSDELPHVALRYGLGYYDTYEQAENAHDIEVLSRKFSGD